MNHTAALKPIARGLLAMTVAGGAAQHASAADLTPVQHQLREIFQELVETNTTNSSGSCTVAVNKMAKRLQAAGYGAADVQVIVPPDGPTKGNLVARLKGDGSKKPLLLLAHVDVVEARREDWTRDPFKLVEEDGVFYGRGVADDKSMAAAFVANMIRYRQDKLPLRRDVILALTCDEEMVPSKFDGADYLLTHHRPLIDAEIVLNEGGGGVLDKAGKPLRHGIQAGEKVYQSFLLEVTNPGGHSSVPRRDNAIYRLADGLSRLGRFAFPFKLSDVTRTFFTRSALLAEGQEAADMKAILTDPPDPAALERLYAREPATTPSCARPASPPWSTAATPTTRLPQRAKAHVNCRILPGEPIAEVQRTLERVLADDAIKVSPIGVAIASPTPPLTPTLMRAVERSATTCGRACR
jgi:acetylornithine deacetylase/succinyl-diaminopimelate desuccinylase-like protein